ncbi:T9SS type A sorting domain-containing protein [Psychroserpens ponticola]|uniref:T9SS type A sorting domain-containing protein n=1 Tax=Psychroserpens ponticola TaxID=2932268 RepID=A0ABY7RZS1_9FLAO|nr:T9SS type A sorting domain-containing protein [Psychroserpens ponticola]WCO02633.1 T9SS type A sorting domain-containing protein [Psychroserpens ponticola]
MRIAIPIITLALIVFNSLTINAQAKNKNYIELEEIRLAKADSINKLIDIFIKTNLPNYELSQNEKNTIADDLYNIHDGTSKPITGIDLESVLLEAKKIKLKQKYFQNKPNDLVFFQPLELPIEFRQSCINGDFEGGYANYTFTERNTTNHLNPGCTGTDDNLVAFQPVGLDNFNALASLVSPGDEPLLASLGISVNRVFSGSRSLKINPTPIDFPDSQIGNRTSVSRNFIINEDQIEFSFLYLGHTNNSHNRAYFRYRLIDNITGEILSTNCLLTINNDCRFIQLADNTYGNNTLTYTPDWICERINTSNLIGRDVTLEFSVSDCEYRGHFSTVYIDNICGVSCSPTWGDLIIDPINIDCPDSNIEVCGTFELPTGTNFTTLTLDVRDDIVVNTISTYVNPVITGNNYCFNVNLSDFGATPSGQYSFDVILNNDSNCNTLSQITASGGLINFDNCSAPCDIVTGEFINNTDLCWDDISDDDYEIEFISQETCPNGAGSSSNPSFVSYTQSANCIDLVNVVHTLGGKCFRWRIRTNCGDWTDWCLIADGSDENNPPFVTFNDCIPTAPCENFIPEIVLESPDDNIPNGITENYDSYIDIIASNTVENGAISLYQASHSIRLVPEFQAQNITGQGSFIARIIPCEPAIIPPSSQRIGQKFEDLDKIKVHPNPASNILNITSKESKILSLQLLNIYGNKLESFENINTYKYSFSVYNHSRGYYILKITLEDGSIEFKTIILK